MKHSASSVSVAPEVTPGRIMELGLGFWASKVLLSAVELGVFTALADGALNEEELGARLGLHRRSRRDFLDALVALAMLEREGGQYSNTPETNLFLDRRKPSYVGGMLEMANDRLFGFWGSLTEGLRTGQLQNEAKTGGDFFDELYKDPDRLRGFLHAMTAISMGAAIAIAQRFPWDKYETVVDVGCAEGNVPVQVALAHPHISGGGFDLPVVRPAFEECVSSFGLGERLRFQEGDFFRDPLPQADVLVMGHILHNWDLDQKRLLLEKAHAALPAGGSLIVYDSIIDDERRANAFGLLMSLNMLIETEGGFDYSGADCSAWMGDAGFETTRVEHLAGPVSMVVGTK
jgi:SAM-dependent methyltransferase